MRPVFSAASLAIKSLMARSSDGQPTRHHQPSATNVIYLFMAGGPSQVDLFDPKPELKQLAGQDVPESLARLVPKIKRSGLQNLMASPWEFKRHGDSGLPISTLIPKTAEHADDLCVIRSMTHRNPVHGPAECVALTGAGGGNRPSLGAWTIYGLGSETEELPEFIAMNTHTSGMQYPQVPGWGTGFLPARFQGTVVDPVQGIRNVKMPAKTSNRRRQDELHAIEDLNRRFLDSIENHSELDARIRSYQMAFRMQTAAPELFDLNSEPRSAHELYGLGDDRTKNVGRACLLARRMVERGVRFVQIRVGGWDAHGNIRSNHTNMAAHTDRPISGLLADLKKRGLLETTLIIWGGEFGRTPTMEGRGNGRDHSPAAYSMWLAGGGVQGGKIVGETDPIGYTVTQRPVTPYDLHATVLHTLGLDAKRLIYHHHGLEETPLGVTNGSAVLEVLRS